VTAETYNTEPHANKENKRKKRKENPTYFEQLV
jgi:hypothetical protein